MTIGQAGVQAIEYVHDNPMRLNYIIDKCMEHRPWFDDYTWDDANARRMAIIRYLAVAWREGKLWEVYDGKDLVGVLLLNEIRYRIDALCHFVFFDHKLADKQALCLSTMQWAFKHLGVHKLSIEVPTYARALANFARKKLGFRYEAEARMFSWPKDASPLTRGAAELGSRKHHHTLYKREWHDVLLLSVTREEFDAFVRSLIEARREEPEGHREPLRNGELPGPDSATGSVVPELPEPVAPESPASPPGPSADERSSETVGQHVQPTGERDGSPAADGDGAGNPWGDPTGLPTEPPAGG